MTSASYESGSMCSAIRPHPVQNIPVLMWVVVTMAATSNSLLLCGTPVALPVRCRSRSPEIKLSFCNSRREQYTWFQAMWRETHVTTDSSAESCFSRNRGNRHPCPPHPRSAFASLASAQVSVDYCPSSSSSRCLGNWTARRREARMHLPNRAPGR